MSHLHSHHSHQSESPFSGKILIFAILINLLFVIIEASVGVFSHSMGLLADAGHNLVDVSSLLITFLAFVLAKRKYSQDYTYGYKKTTILASLCNAILLFVAVAFIVVECLKKLVHPEPIQALPIILTAGVGILINGITTMMLNHGKEHDLNIKGAYLHMLADTLVSIGVVFSGGLIYLTGWTILDPLIGLGIATFIVLSSWDLLKDSVRLALDGVPLGIKPEDIREDLLTIPNVSGVHHLHIWPISTTENAFTAHIVLDDLLLLEETKHLLQEELKEHDIKHSTLEFEVIPCSSQSNDCSHC